LVNFDDNLVVLLMANSQWRRHFVNTAYAPGILSKSKIN
jgi:hypothetical protein